MGDDTSERPEETLKERSGCDRRSHIDRRRKVAPWTGDNHREGNRRKATDRRGLPFGVFYKTNKPMAILYDWLGAHCYGKWSVGLEQAEDNPLKKAVKVLFELENDKDTFMQEVVRS